jgi:hypothetical protein
LAASLEPDDAEREIFPSIGGGVVKFGVVIGFLSYNRKPFVPSETSLRASSEPRECAKPWAPHGSLSAANMPESVDGP